MDWSGHDRLMRDLADEVEELRASSPDLESFVLGLVPKLVERDRRQTEQILELRTSVLALEAKLEGRGLAAAEINRPESARSAPGSSDEWIECQSCGARVAESLARNTNDGLLCEPCASIPRRLV
ncbi:MAG: hypothetical protein HY791_08420 [Deltaproteobacteria bacterium]|nr:hypothetical protein [Deltaproteobacteria bacterium]